MFSLFDITAKRADLTPDKVAMEELVTGTRVTYAELDARAARAASLLTDEGVGAGDRVAILCRNRIEFFELLFACGKLGAILVPLNWRMPANELRPLIEDSAPRLAVCGAEDAATMTEALAGRTGLLSLDDGYRERRDAAARHPGRLVWPAGETWYLLYTSGTTGLPKAVIQTYGMALVNAINIGRAIDLRNDDVTLNFLPLFHTAGINLHTLPALIAGGQVLVLPGFDADRMIALLAQNRLDSFFGVPAVYQELSLHPDFETVDLTGVRSWGCGGAPLPDVLIETYAKRGVQVCNGMGMTETGPTVFLMDPPSAAKKIGSVGKPQLLATIRIVDTDGNDVPQGETGELWISGPGVTPGYWDRSDVTAAAFSPDGWLKSGDLARQDADGYTYIVGRSKDMFISGGENVYPAEVENVLAEHPAILEAAVVGVPDERWGEVGRAYLLPRPEQTIPDDASLAAFCRERLAAYKAPKSFVAVSEFPRTAAGKIQKHLIEAPE